MIQKNDTTGSQKIGENSLFDRVSLLLEKYFGITMVSPILLVLTLLLLGPLVYTIFLSFHTWFAGSGPPSFVGLENFTRLINSQEFLKSLRVTAIFTGGSLALEIALGIGLAQLLNRDFIGKSLVRTVLILPLASTPVALSLVWRLMLLPDLGILNYFIELVGFSQVTFLSSSRLIIPTLIVIDAWRWTPLIMLIAMASMASIPDTYYQAARVDGASPFQQFVHITLPLIRPAVIVAAMLRFMDSLKQFDMIFVLTQGGPGTSSRILNLFVYDNAFRYFHLGYASAAVVIMILLIAGFSLMLSRLRRST